MDDEESRFFYFFLFGNAKFSSVGRWSGGGGDDDGDDGGKVYFSSDELKYSHVYYGPIYYVSPKNSTTCYLFELACGSAHRIRNDVAWAGAGSKNDSINRKEQRIITH